MREISLDDCDDCKKASPCHPTVERNSIKVPIWLVLPRSRKSNITVMTLRILFLRYWCIVLMNANDWRKRFHTNTWSLLHELVILISRTCATSSHILVSFRRSSTVVAGRDSGAMIVNTSCVTWQTRESRTPDVFDGESRLEPSFQTTEQAVSFSLVRRLNNLQYRWGRLKVSVAFEYKTCGVIIRFSSAIEKQLWHVSVEYMLGISLEGWYNVICI